MKERMLIIFSCCKLSNERGVLGICGCGNFVVRGVDLSSEGTC